LSYLNRPNSPARKKRIKSRPRKSLQLKQVKEVVLRSRKRRRMQEILF
jgi:hypothetical protein